MASSTPTIIDLKLSFLSSQIRALSQPLTPSDDFTTSNNSSEEDHLRQKHIDDALHKLNERLKRHNKLRYGAQAQRHVAEQIDRLYWNAGERGVVTLESGEEWVERGNDYRQEKTISLLPPTWSSEAETKSPAEAQRYKDLQQRLVALNEKRAAARARAENHRRLKALVDSFDRDAGVQENLVNRNGEIEVELERMRRLMVRVERGLDVLEGGGERGEMDGDFDGDIDREDRKVLALLG